MSTSPPTDHGRLLDRHWRTPTSGPQSHGSAQRLDWRHAYHSTAYQILDELVERWEYENSAFAIPWVRLRDKAYAESARITDRAINVFNENITNGGRG